MRKFIVTVKDKKYEVSVEEVGGQPQEAAAEPVEVKAEAPEVQQPATSGGEAVKAPLAGTILSVKVNVGDKVEAGTVLATLEALKLENEVPSPRAGVVKAVLVTPGQTVSTGDPLVELE